MPGPVKWTRPYFDCGRSNKWLVAAVVPIADIYPRHTSFRHIEYPTYVCSYHFSHCGWEDSVLGLHTGLWLGRIFFVFTVQGTLISHEKTPVAICMSSD